MNAGAGLKVRASSGPSPPYHSSSPSLQSISEDGSQAQDQKGIDHCEGVDKPVEVLRKHEKKRLSCIKERDKDRDDVELLKFVDGLRSLRMRSRVVEERGGEAQKKRKWFENDATPSFPGSKKLAQYSPPEEGEKKRSFPFNLRSIRKPRQARRGHTPLPERYLETRRF